MKLGRIILSRLVRGTESKVLDISAYRRVCKSVVLAVRKSYVSHAEALEVPQYAGTVSDLVQTFNANEARHSPGLKDGQNVGGTLCECKHVRILAHQVVNKINLLQCVVDCSHVRFVRFLAIPFARCQRDANICLSVSVSNTMPPCFTEEDHTMVHTHSKTGRPTGSDEAFQGLFGQ